MKRTILICAATSLATSMVGGLLAGAFLMWMRGTNGDWLGFAGGVMGGLMTLLAAAVAFGVTRQQVNLQAEELRTFHYERRARAAGLRVSIYQSLHRIQADEQVVRQQVENGGDVQPLEVASLKKLPSVFDLVGYGELWRIAKDEIIEVTTADFAIYKYNSMLDRHHTFGITKVQGQAVLTYLNPIKSSLGSLIQRLKRQ